MDNLLAAVRITVLPSDYWETSNKVQSFVGPETTRQKKKSKKSRRRLMSCLALSTYRTGGHIFTGVNLNSGPPEPPFKEEQGSLDLRVAKEVSVMGPSPDCSSGTQGHISTPWRGPSWVQIFSQSFLDTLLHRPGEGGHHTLGVQDVSRSVLGICYLTYPRKSIKFDVFGT